MFKWISVASIFTFKRERPPPPPPTGSVFGGSVAQWLSGSGCFWRWSCELGRKYACALDVSRYAACRCCLCTTRLCLQRAYRITHASQMSHTQAVVNVAIKIIIIRSYGFIHHILKDLIIFISHCIKKIAALVTRKSFLCS